MPFSAYNEQAELKINRAQAFTGTQLQGAQGSISGPRAESVDMLNDCLGIWKSNLCFVTGLIG